MAVNTDAYQNIKEELEAKNVKLVAVSKTKPISGIQALYDLGQRNFGENYVQELTEKQKQLPKDIRWHFIGHLQRNKVKEIAAFVHLIHGVDSQRLLVEINKQALKCNRIIPVLLQVHIAREETKFGLDENELTDIMKNISGLNNITVNGLMGMASLTEDAKTVRLEFRHLKTLFNQLSSQSNEELSADANKLAAKQHALLTTHHLPPATLSMGMSSDYRIAIEEGSNMVRIGSLLFGLRE